MKAPYKWDIPKITLAKKNKMITINIPEGTSFNADYNDLYPIIFNGVLYFEKQCDELFVDFYTCKSALTEDGSVYISDGLYVYPDGTFYHEK
jgi:hypothetical protein